MAILPEAQHFKGGDCETAVDVRGLSRTFGRKLALQNIDFQLPVGCVCGLVGVNGAGKTTLIKHLLGLLKAQHGSVSVFGADPIRDPKKVLSHVGYLSETGELPGWMRVKELFSFLRPLYLGWDDRYAEDLRARFDLDPNARLRNLSKGQKARAGLIAALAHRPRLLLLDEPSSGLDPLVRRDILTAIVRTIADEGRTVLFSSHLLDEVERVCDRIAMLRGGQMVFQGELEAIKRVRKRIVFHFSEARLSPPVWKHAISWEGGGQTWSALALVDGEDRWQLETSEAGSMVEQSPASLDDIFRAYCKQESAPTANGSSLANALASGAPLI